MSKEENRDCRICGKPYVYDVERTVSIMEDNTGMEYVVCEKCFNKVKSFIKKMKK